MPVNQSRGKFEENFYFFFLSYVSNYKLPVLLDRVIPNCIMKAKSEKRRPFIGDQIEECRDASGLFYILGFQKVRHTRNIFMQNLIRFSYNVIMTILGLFGQLGGSENRVGLHFW